MPRLEFARARAPRISPVPTKIFQMPRLLHDGGSSPHPPIEGHIINPERDEVTGAQLAVGCQVEQSKVANAVSSLDLTRMDQIPLSFRRQPGPY
jgi:hypothetical protein